MMSSSLSSALFWHSFNWPWVAAMHLQEVRCYHCLVLTASSRSLAVVAGTQYLFCTWCSVDAVRYRSWHFRPKPRPLLPLYILSLVW